MKNSYLIKFLGTLGLLIVLVISTVCPLAVSADNGADNSTPDFPVELMENSTIPVAGVEQENGSSEKVSSLLSMHIKLKTEALNKSVELFPDQTSPLGIDTQKMDSEELVFEKVYLYFDEFPTKSQLAELESVGLTVFPDSWVPPVGNHPAGFMLAEMPVDKLEATSEKNYLVRIDTAEAETQPANDLARQTMGVGSVWSGGNAGEGVTVAVLDSGIDTSSPDFPVLDSSNSKNYSGYNGTPESLDDNITNNVTGHGTHVAGSVLGRGNNSAVYKGVAPGADLVFLKIGNDVTGGASTAAMAKAIIDAVDVYKADIITTSYGGWSEYHDGSDAICQAADYAVSKGATFFASAGNEAADGWHYSGTVSSKRTSSYIPFIISGDDGENSALLFNLVWYDGLNAQNSLKLRFYDSAKKELTTIVDLGQSESDRGTESNFSFFDQYVGSGTYYLKVQNLSSTKQQFHLYYNDYFNENDDVDVSFKTPDPDYTIGSPAEADSAIAVGAYVTRINWTDYMGNNQGYTSQTFDSIGTFSSRGPRLDNSAIQKPEIVAPGVGIISVRDNDVYSLPDYNENADIPEYTKYVIDNDGNNLDGSGPADYFVMSGTSMACPQAAGVAALILSQHPEYTPENVKSILETTATDKGKKGFDTIYGYGLINADLAVNYTEPASISGSLPEGVVKSVYPEQTLTVIGGAAPYTWSVVKGYKLPSGLKLKVLKDDTSSAVISGKPTRADTFPFKIQVKDKFLNSIEQEFMIKINPALKITTPSLPKSEVGVEYPSWTPAASGGDGKYYWSITGVPLPADLSLDNSTGSILGVPKASGTTKIKLTLTDGSGSSISKTLSVKILPVLSVITTTLPSGKEGSTYKTTYLKASGGTKIYSWTWEGELPPGLDINSKGQIKGKPFAGTAKTYEFTVKVEDTLLGSATQKLSITISP